MSLSDDIYRKLQKHIDSNMPVDFPETDSGVEIDILKEMFSPREAEIALEVSSVPEPAKKIHSRLKNKINFDELLEILDKLVKKGAIMGPAYYKNLGLGTRYGKAPFIVGIYEFQAGRLTKELEKKTRNYLDEKYRDVVLSRKTPQMRTIPVGKSISPDNVVATYNNAREIIKNADERIVVLPCVCREGSDLLGEPCKVTDLRETCILLNENAAMYSEFKMGRRLSRAEALDIIDRAEEAGLVLQPANNCRPGFICCCCGCCCGMIVNLKKLPEPAKFFSSDFYAEVNPDLCNGCRKCFKKCQMDAVQFDNKKAVIDLAKCIGCGVCVSACPENAVSLREKEKKARPPKNVFSMYRRLLFERYGIPGMLKMAIKALTGKKL